MTRKRMENKQTNKKTKKQKRVIQSAKEKVFFLVVMVIRDLGTVTVVDDTSNMEKFLRKKYMRVCR